MKTIPCQFCGKEPSQNKDHPNFGVYCANQQCPVRPKAFGFNLEDAIRIWNGPSPWRPIETAPKDGSEMILSFGEHMTVGKWEQDFGGNWIESDSRDVIEPKPTHWMPLPEKP